MFPVLSGKCQWSAEKHTHRSTPALDTATKRCHALGPRNPEQQAEALSLPVDTIDGFTSKFPTRLATCLLR